MSLLKKAREAYERAEVLRKEWAFLLDGQLHTVLVEHGYLSALRRIYVDGELTVAEPATYRVDLGSRHVLRLGAHECVVGIHINLQFAPKFELTIDGVPVSDLRFAPPGESLLRASQAPAAPGDTLLRPASGGPPPEADELLRAGDAPVRPEEG